MEEQFGTAPGKPLMVWASETFGARPELKASFMTASVSDFHHSADKKYIYMRPCVLNIIQDKYTKNECLT